MVFNYPSIAAVADFLQHQMAGGKYGKNGPNPKP
jgi:hypothetical protein